jgi:hypothetical protein
MGKMMQFQYNILDHINHKEKGVTLLELSQDFPNLEKKELAKILGESEFIGFLRSDWVMGLDNRWEQRFFISNDMPDGITKLRLNKNKKQKP